MRSWIVLIAALGACAEQPRAEPRPIEPHEAHETHETRACPDIALPRDATPELRAVASVLSALFESFRRSEIDRDVVAEPEYPEVAPEKIEAFTHASLCVRRIVRSDLAALTPTVDVEVSSPEAGYTMRLALEHDERWRLNLARAADEYDELRRMRVAEQVIASHPGARVEHQHSMGLDTTWMRGDERNVMCLTGPQHIDEGPTATLCFETPWDEPPSAAFQADAEVHVCVRAEPAHVWIAWPSGATFEGSCDRSGPSQRAARCWRGWRSSASSCASTGSIACARSTPRPSRSAAAIATSSACETAMTSVA